MCYKQVMTYETSCLPLEPNPSTGDRGRVSTRDQGLTPEPNGHLHVEEHEQGPTDEQPGGEARIRCWRRAIWKTLENAKVPGDDDYKY